MPQLSPEGQAAINAISQRTGFSPDAVTSMLFSVIAGNGTAKEALDGLVADWHATFEEEGKY